MRDPQKTRRRLLEAATAEFAAYGIAGARVDRVAETAGCNKQSIYGHFGSKEALFDAVFDTMVESIISGVPIESHDLPGYAAHFFDWYQSHPEVLRLATWQQLQRGGMAEIGGAAAKANQKKVAKVREAQEAGVVTRAIPAQHLLLLIYRLTTVQLDHVSPDKARRASLRRALVEAVRRLIAP